jgi:hypothetical protein
MYSVHFYSYIYTSNRCRADTYIMDTTGGTQWQQVRTITDGELTHTQRNKGRSTMETREREGQNNERIIE